MAGESFKLDIPLPSSEQQAGIAHGLNSLGEAVFGGINSQEITQETASQVKELADKIDIESIFKNVRSFFKDEVAGILDSDNSGLRSNNRGKIERRTTTREHLLREEKKLGKLFPLGEYIENHGLTENTKITISGLLNNIGIHENHKKLIEGWRIFTKYTLDIESQGGYDLKNGEVVRFKKGTRQAIKIVDTGRGSSSAEGRLQYLSGNGSIKSGRYSSYITALRHTNKYYTGQHTPGKDSPKWIQNNYNDSASPSDLNAEQLLIMFSCDYFAKYIKKGRGKGEILAKHLNDIAEGNQWSLKELYFLHHTNPDKKTEEIMISMLP